jgi:hypothetical protein
VRSSAVDLLSTLGPVVATVLGQHNLLEAITRKMGVVSNAVLKKLTSIRKGSV